MGSAVIIILVVIVDWPNIVAVNAVVTAPAITETIVDIAAPRGKVIGQGVYSLCVPIVWLDKVRIVVVVICYLITPDPAGLTRNERF